MKQVSSDKTGRLGLAMLLVAAGATLAHGAEVTVPHVFSSGTPASAAEVNANFAAVKAGVDDNARAIVELRGQLQGAPRASLSVVVDGARLGTFVTGGPDDPNFGNGNELLAVSDFGYFFGVSLADTDDGSPVLAAEGALAPADLYFTQPDCAGTKHLAFEYGAFRFMWRQGFVVASPDPVDPAKAYRAKGLPTELSMYSARSRTSQASSACRNLAPAEIRRALVAQPNDAAVTGVPSDPSGVVQLTLK